MRGIVGAAIGATATLVFFAAISLLGKIGPTEEPETPLERTLTTQQIDYIDIPGWRSDDHAAALATFQRSCAAIEKKANAQAALSRPHPDHPELAEIFGSISDWQGKCAVAADVLPGDARAFFETHFVPMLIAYDQGETALATGYFEPEYRASHVASDGYTTPILGRPDDLVMVHLGGFRSSLRGTRIAGRVTNGQLSPFEDHQALIETPPANADVFGYLDPNDLLFLQIQGSGRLVFDDGEIKRVGYAGQNGHAYVPVGRTLVREGHLALEEVTMASIRTWLASAPAEAAAAVRYSNPSYVFFRVLDNLPEPDLGPLGAQGVQLTPDRSMAIDPRYYPYGLPIWVSVDPADGSSPINRLMIAQDTGGAIRGVQRADIFFGAGDAAAEAAGALKSPIKMLALVPNPSDAE